MIRHLAITATLCAGLMGCAQVSDMAETTARDTAKTVITPVVEAQFPGVPVGPATDCIIDNATLAEVFELAKAATLGVSAETTQTVISIASRPETITCIGKASAPSLLDRVLSL